MRFHQAFSTVNLGASTCFALANAKRFLFEEEAKMARDFGDFDGMRRTQISRGACGSPFVSVFQSFVSRTKQQRCVASEF